jgi:tetratricopeptide (TPR) repeat protein
MDYDRLRELQEKFDENPRRYFAPLANEYRKGGQPKRAIEICRAHLAQMPGHMSGQIVYGQSLFEAGEVDEAKEVFSRALSLDPENLIALRSLGDMSLQAGKMGEARSWYTRLLDADPKDTAVIALVSEIDAAEDAAPAGRTEIPGVDADAGDQQIPAGLEMSSELVFLESRSEQEEAARDAEASPPPASPEPPAPVAEAAPAGLERHYPVQEASPEDSAPEASPAETFIAESPSVETPSPEAPAQAREASAHASAAEGSRAEDLGVPAGDSAAEGLTSDIPEAANPLDWSGPPPAASVEEPAAPAARAPESVAAASAFASAPPPEPPARAPEPIARAPEPPARAPEPPRSEERGFSGASSEPFVNETMAQLYLQQGYKQLALQVYRQLAVARPQDEGLRNRIAEIEADDAATHPGEVPAARKETPLERSRAPEEPAVRQPSIREFFATLGRRRPPSPMSRGGSRATNNQPAPADTRAPLAPAPPGANLDTVFAGATVSPADARAASRLAGAFSGTSSGSGRTSPPTPPMPTPRVNPRVPQAQESEEDVAKFRAWLDGLTGE